MEVVEGGRAMKVGDIRQLLDLLSDDTQVFRIGWNGEDVIPTDTDNDEPVEFSIHDIGTKRKPKSVLLIKNLKWAD